MNRYVKKLDKNNYNGPSRSFTDGLTDEQIQQKLIGYKESNINNIPLGCHVRYFVSRDNKKLFRTGGLLHKNDGLPKYVILSNGENSWSVQVAGTQFFKKVSTKEKDEAIDNTMLNLKKLNNDLSNKNKKYEQKYSELQQKYSNLEDKYNSIYSKYSKLTKKANK